MADRGTSGPGGGQPVDDGLLVFTNDGLGHLVRTAAYYFNVADDGPAALRLGDLDGDGDLDATVAVRSHAPGAAFGSAVLTALNDGAGKLAWGGAYPADRAPTGMVLSDLDADGALDYATVNWESRSVSVVFGHGDGTFDATATSYAVGIYPSVIEAGDFDGDGDVDLTVGWKYGVTALLNQGAGTFTNGLSMLLGYYPKAMVTCDFDQDGHLDLLTTFANSATLEFLRGSGNATFAPVASYVAGSQAYALAAGDWNRDGILDAAVADNSGSELRILTSTCAPATYCTAKPNSQGCTPAMATSGQPSVSGTAPFLLKAAQLLNKKSGLLFYGFAPAATPFQGGVLCVATPLSRTAAQNSGGSPTGSDCSGTFAFDFNALIRSASVPGLSAGAQVYGQYISRDPADPLGFGTSLTDAVTFRIEP